LGELKFDNIIILDSYKKDKIIIENMPGLARDLHLLIFTNQALVFSSFFPFLSFSKKGCQWQPFLVLIRY